ncbi:MAG TPA: single-stranded DNA-binding protein [Patescibacteria group bacterium]|nr:single-stranded DNA-binding protein [Patescibacteria group bacterium]
MARSLNRAQLIGNLTRDPELRYTPSGAAVCSFSIATNRAWTTDTGEKHDEAEFHKIVAWNKLAELCSQFLTKGRKVFLEGRISTRSYNAQDGTAKSITEIVISDMILLDSRKQEPSKDMNQEEEKEVKEVKEIKKVSKKDVKKEDEEQIAPDDIPF